ncbi:MAG: IS1182 family transposase [Thermomonas sp.]
MPTTYRPYEPNQILLLPPSVSDWLPDGHLAHFINDAVDALDLGAFHARYEGDGRRNMPFDPAMLVKVVLYGFASGVVSSRQVARKLHEDVAFRILAAENFPAHRTIREFRQVHRDALGGLFVQVVKLAHEAGLLKLGRVGIDGTKLKANASKRKAMSYGRMQSEEVRLKAEIAALMKQAEAVDDKEDRQFGADRTGEELSDELARRESRLATIQAAKARLEARQREADRAAGRKPGDDEPRSGKRGKAFKRPLGEPRSEAQENFTDPDSRIMRTADGYQQGYNAQAAVDESLLIVAATLTNNASDATQLLPVLEQTQANLGQSPQMLLADAGYASEANLLALEEAGQAACIALGREGKTASRAIDPVSHPATARMHERMSSDEGKAHYRRRKTLPEPVFGWIKNVLGIVRFGTRGLAKVQAEWQLICAAMNLRRLHKMGWNPA